MVDCPQIESESRLQRSGQGYPNLRPSTCGREAGNASRVICYFFTLSSTSPKREARSFSSRSMS